MRAFRVEAQATAADFIGNSVFAQKQRNIFAGIGEYMQAHRRILVGCSVQTGQPARIESREKSQRLERGFAQPAQRYRLAVALEQALMLT